MMTLSELKLAKKELGYSCEEIASRSGVPLSTVQKIFSGVTERPRSDTLRQLTVAFSEVRPSGVAGIDACSTREYRIHSLDEEADRIPHMNRARRTDRVAESASDYGKVLAQEPAFEPGSRAPFQRQGTYTIEDYYRVPEDRRVELIDGVFYDMGAPRVVHQHLVMFVSAEIYNYIRANNGDCIPFAAPTDVRLDILRDDRTMVQPDIFVVCDENQLEDGKVVKGAPDFVVEILSPSTRKKDMTKKLEKYTDAGVREYWIIDPQKGQVITYDLEHDCGIAIYTFAQRVPVMIYDGKLEIDFPHMPKYIARLYDENWQLQEA